MTLDYSDGSILVEHTRHDKTQWVESLPGAVRVDESKILIPATRTNFIAVEASGSFTAATDIYRDQRKLAVSPSEEQLEETRVALREAGFDPSLLLSHQLEFVTMARPLRGVFNVSEQGTGKTRMSLALLCLWAPRTGLVVAPKSVVTEWEREANECKVPLNVLVLDKGPVKKRADKFVEAANRSPVIAVTNYEALRALSREASLRKVKIDTIVADESWRLKSRTAQVTKVFSVWARAAEHVILLTGTPIGNDIGDLWSQVKCIEPNCVHDRYWDFMGAHCLFKTIRMGSQIINKPVGVVNPGGLMSRIQHFWFRATKETCFELPPKVHRRVKIDLSPLARQWYEQVQNRGEQAMGNELSLSGERVTMLRLQQVSGGHVAVFPESLERRLESDLSGDTEDWAETAARLFGSEAQLYSLPCSKIDWIVCWAQDLLVGNPTYRAIVWCRFNAEVFRVTHALASVLDYDRVRAAWGETSNEELTRIKSSFNSRSSKGVQVIVAQIKKMAYGHNLQACDTMVYFSPTWSYVERAQSEDRAHRLGREGGVEYIDLVARDTIDEAVMKALDRKEDLAVQMSVETI